jgi:Lysophospholipase catalytic domain
LLLLLAGVVAVGNKQCTVQPEPDHPKNYIITSPSKATHSFLSTTERQPMLRHYLFTLAFAGVVYAINGSVADYAPALNQPCPNITTNPLLRVFTPKNQSLNSGEEEYVKTRLTTVIPNEWANWIGDGSAIGYNLSSFNSTGFPKIGIAISGGGLRAAQYGAGVLSALDARNESAKTAGTGGLLQVSSYLSGLSGASQSQPVCSRG